MAKKSTDDILRFSGNFPIRTDKVREESTGVIPEFSGNPEDLNDFVNMILTDMTDEQLAYYAVNKFAEEGITTPSGYTLPKTNQGGMDCVGGVDTDLPLPIHVGQSWDIDLIKEVGEVIGNERRGEVNSDDPNTVTFTGLADLRINPLNGRYYESYAEDTYMVGKIADTICKEAIGEDGFYTKTAVSTKHYHTYACEFDRVNKTNFINNRALREYEYPAFLPAIQNDSITGLMTSYGSVDGVPLPYTPQLKEIQKEFKYSPFVISDYNADGYTLEGLGNGYDETYAKTPQEVAALLMKAKAYSNNFEPTTITPEHNLEVIQKELLGLTRKDLEEQIRPQIELWVRSGYFNYDAYPYKELSADYNPVNAQTPRHQEIALKAAQGGIVMLKNENNTLPLDAGTKAMVTGMMANSRVQTYYSVKTPEGIENTGFTPLEALRSYTSDQEQFTFAPELTGKHFKVKSTVTGKYLQGQDDGTVTADSDTGSVFELYDWGQETYSLLELSTNRFLGSDAVRLTTDNFFEQLFIWAGIKPNVIMEADDKELTPRVWTIEESEDGKKYLRYRVRTSEIWQQIITGIPFYENTFKSGWHLEVDPDTNKVFLGASTEDGPNANDFYEIEEVSEAGTGVETYVTDNDHAIVFVGADSHINASEFTDRCDLALGKDQVRLVEKVANAFPGNTVVVVRADLPMGIEPIQNNPNVGAILFIPYAGQYDNYALAQTIFGENNPSGRLTGTWLKDISSLPKLKPENRVGVDPRYTVDMKNGDPQQLGLTYMYNREEDTIYSFGHGLSYTSFEYSDIAAAVQNNRKDIKLSFTVTNTGDVAGREVVQIYAASENSAYGSAVPKKKLIMFEKTKVLEPGESQAFELTLDTQGMQKWDVNRKRYFLETGFYTIMLGEASDNILWSQRVSIQGESLGNSDIQEGVNVWESSFDSVDTYGVEFSKRNTTDFAGDYFSVESQEPGAYVVMANVNMDEIVQLKLMAASAEQASSVEVYLDSLESTMLAQFEIPQTGTTTYYLDEENTISVTEPAYTTLTSAIEAQRGIHNLYLKFNESGTRVYSLIGNK